MNPSLSFTRSFPLSFPRSFTQSFPRSCRLLLLILLLPLLLAMSAARAGSLEVAPTSHDLANGQTITSMTITNRGDAATTLQVRGFLWSQSGAQDELLPADGLLVAPAIFSLAPGRSQVVRVRVTAAPPGQEAAYRLLIDELPAVDAGEQIRMALRLSVPLFARGAATAAPQLTAQVDPAGETLTLINRGGRRARVHELNTQTADGARQTARPTAGLYLLPGAQRAWRLPPGSRLSAVSAPPSVVATTDDGPVDVPLLATR